METPLPCPKCKTAEHIDVYDCGAGVTVSCSNCYDADCVGDPPRYVSSSLTGGGRWRSEAVADWNAQVEEANYEAEDAPTVEQVRSKVLEAIEMSKRGEPGPVTAKLRALKEGSK